MPQDGEGLKGTFQSVFPIKDFNETAVLEFVKYELEPPKYDVEECMQRDMTYAAPLKVTLRLIVFEVDEETGARSVKDIKEQDVYMGDMPLMTPNGTFIVNGTERVIVSPDAPLARRLLRPRPRQDPLVGQAALHLPRHPLPRLVARLRVRRQGHRLRPHRPPPEAAGDDAALCARHGPGRDHGGLLRHRDLPQGRQLLGDPLLPGAAARHQADPRHRQRRHRRGDRAGRQEDHPAHGQGVAGHAATSPRSWCRSTPSSAASSRRDIINEETGLIWVEAGDELTWDIDAKTGDVTGGTLKVLLDNGVTEIPTLDVDNITVGAYIRNTMAVDKNMNRDQALMDIYRVMRPGEPPTVEAADVHVPARCSSTPSATTSRPSAGSR